MQRQSLGSPGSKHNARSSVDLSGGSPELKTEKPLRSSLKSWTTIHWIPILTFFCFLILYLISYEPSPSDLPRIRGIERIIGQTAGSVSGSVSSAIRTKRGLMEEKTQIRSRRLGIP